MPPAALPPPGQILREALLTPRHSLARMLDLDLAPGDVWLGATLAAILSVVLLYGGALISGPGQSQMLTMLPPPFLVVTLQIGLTALMALMTARLGAMAGGRGGFSAALTAVVWLQLLMVVMQAVQIVVALLVPPLAGLVSLGGIGLFFWLLTHFVAEVHGFRNLAQVFGAVVLAMIGAALAIGVALSIILGSVMGTS